MINKNLEQAFEKYQQVISRKDFSRYILTQMGRELFLYIPLDEISSVYSQLSKILDKESSDFEFIWRGKTHAQKLQSEQKVHMRMTANSMSRLEKVLEDHGVPLPLWLPRTYSELNEDFDFIPHRRVYFFLWNTVQPQFIGFQERTSVEMYIRRFAANNGLATDEDCEFAAEESSSILSSNPQLQALKNDMSSRQEDNKKDGQFTSGKSTNPPQENTANSASSYLTAERDDVEHEVAAARQFLRLHEKSVDENKAFALTLDHVKTLLKSKTCSLSELPLSFNTADGHSPVVDLKDSTNDITPDNVQACANVVSRFKDQVDENDFKQIISTMKLMKNKNIDHSFLFEQ